MVSGRITGIGLVSVHFKGSKLRINVFADTNADASNFQRSSRAERHAFGRTRYAYFTIPIDSFASSPAVAAHVVSPRLAERIPQRYPRSDQHSGPLGS